MRSKNTGPQETDPLMVVDSDFKPLASADPTRDMCGHFAVVAAQGEGEGHLAVDNLQTHKVMLLIKAAIVQEQPTLFLCGKPAARRNQCCQCRHNGH